MATLVFKGESDPERHPAGPALADQLLLIVAGNSVWGERSALPRLSAELELARQNRRTLALVVFRSDSPFHDPRDRETAASSGTAPDAAGQGRQSSMAMAALLRDATRTIDSVSYAPSQPWCLVAMPEVTETEAAQATRRLQRVCATTLVAPVRAGLALFPRDGLTLEALISSAEREAAAMGAPRVVPKPDRRRLQLTLVRNATAEAANS